MTQETKDRIPTQPQQLDASLIGIIEQIPSQLQSLSDRLERVETEVTVFAAPKKSKLLKRAEKYLKTVEKRRAEQKEMKRLAQAEHLPEETFNYWEENFQRLLDKPQREQRKGKPNLQLGITIYEQQKQEMRTQQAEVAPTPAPLVEPQISTKIVDSEMKPQTEGLLPKIVYNRVIGEAIIRGEPLILSEGAQRDVFACLAEHGLQDVPGHALAELDSIKKSTREWPIGDTIYKLRIKLEEDPKNPTTLTRSGEPQQSMYRLNSVVEFVDQEMQRHEEEATLKEIEPKLTEIPKTEIERPRCKVNRETREVILDSKRWIVPEGDYWNIANHIFSNLDQEIPTPKLYEIAPVREEDGKKKYPVRDFMRHFREHLEVDPKKPQLITRLGKGHDTVYQFNAPVEFVDEIEEKLEAKPRQEERKQGAKKSKDKFTVPLPGDRTKIIQGKIIADCTRKITEATQKGEPIKGEALFEAVWGRQYDRAKDRTRLLSATSDVRAIVKNDKLSLAQKTPQDELRKGSLPSYIFETISPEDGTRPALPAETRDQEKTVPEQDEWTPPVEKTPVYTVPSTGRTDIIEIPYSPDPEDIRTEDEMIVLHTIINTISPRGTSINDRHYRTTILPDIVRQAVEDAFKRARGKNFFPSSLNAKNVYALFESAYKKMEEESLFRLPLSQWTFDDLKLWESLHGTEKVDEIIGRLEATHLARVLWHDARGETISEQENKAGIIKKTNSQTPHMFLRKIEGIIKSAYSTNR